MQSSGKTMSKSIYNVLTSVYIDRRRVRTATFFVYTGEESKCIIKQLIFNFFNIELIIVQLYSTMQNKICFKSEAWRHRERYDKAISYNGL